MPSSTDIVRPVLHVDPARQESWPKLLRETDIVRNTRTGYAGILPIGRTTFRSLITDGIVSPGMPIGNKIKVWTREEIAAIVKRGIKRRSRGKRALARQARRAAAEPELPADH